MLIAQGGLNNYILFVTPIIAYILGLINYLTATKTSFLCLGIFFILLGSTNIVYGKELLNIIVPLALGIIILKKYWEKKDIEITEKDREMFKKLNKSFRTNNYLKIKLIDTINSRLWKCIKINNDIIIKSKYGTQLYLTDKDNFIINNTKEKSKKCTGNLLMNGKEYKFVILKKYCDNLESWLN